MNKEIKINEYKDFILEVKSKIQNAQIKAISRVNQEMLLLYWEIGNMILERQEKSNWGDKVLSKIEKDLRKEFPNVKGFSKTNLIYMRVFAKSYPDFLNGEQPVHQISWSHNMYLMKKCDTLEERLWYAHQAIENGWSRSVMLMQIESKLYERQGKAVTNFDKTLPEPESDMAKQALKDPYNFDFLTLSGKANERNIENSLVNHITQFLLELGKGFAYVGQQYHLPVGESDYYIDLLFYHLKLRCYVVIDLKTKKFKPEYAGKVNFYLNAVNDLVKHKDDNATIGIILCKDDKGKISEIDYALKNINQPIGVSDFRITDAIPDELKSSLPTIEDVERELNDSLGDA